MACPGNSPPSFVPTDGACKSHILHGMAKASSGKPKLMDTVLSDVGPGDTTGIYYIPLCNLPFRTSWEGLRDFILDVCPVDYVQIFQSSTSGWVRIKGRENFEKAWVRLNGGYFNGRCIIASDKNRTEAIKIKEVVGYSQPSSQGSRAETPLSQYATQPPSTPKTEHEAPESSVPSPQFATASRASEYSSVYRGVPRPFDYPIQSVPTSNYSAAPSAVGNGNPSRQTNNRLYVEQNTSPGPDHDSLDDNPSTSARQHSYPFRYGDTHPQQSRPHQYRNFSPAAWNKPGGYSRTEPRKVFVTHIIREAPPEEVTAWIREKLGPFAGHIESIEVPLRPPGSLTRGHAFVVFGKASSALKAIAMLDGTWFRDFMVRARLAAEGVPVYESLQPLYNPNWRGFKTPKRTPTHSPMQSPRQAPRYTPKQAPKPGIGQLKSSPKEFVPLAAKLKTRRASKGALPEFGKHKNADKCNTAQPVVVDGSSSKKKTGRSKAT